MIHQWSENELRTFTLGTGMSLAKFASVGGSLGVAKDQKGNVYKVYMVSGNVGISLDNFNVNDVVKALSKVTVGMSSQKINGDYDAIDLMKEYTKDSFTVNATHAGISVGLSRPVGELDKNGTGSYGGSSSLTDVNIGYIHLEYVGNVNE